VGQGTQHESTRRSVAVGGQPNGWISTPRRCAGREQQSWQWWWRRRSVLSGLWSV